MNYNLGQDMKPEAATQQFAITGYKREFNTEQGKQRVEQVRTPKFAYFQGPQPQTQMQVLDGDIAFNVGANGAATRLGTATAERDRRTDFFHHPITALERGHRPAHHGHQRPHGRQRPPGGFRVPRSRSGR